MKGAGAQNTSHPGRTPWTLDRTRNRDRRRHDSSTSSVVKVGPPSATAERTMFLYHAWPWDVNLMVPQTPSAVLVKKKSVTWSREDEVLRGSADRLLTANALCSSGSIGQGETRMPGCFNRVAQRPAESAAMGVLGRGMIVFVARLGHRFVSGEAPSVAPHVSCTKSPGRLSSCQREVAHDTSIFSGVVDGDDNRHVGVIVSTMTPSSS